MTSEAPQDVAALPQTEAGKRLLNWSAYDGVARLEEILEIEREATAGLLDQNDRLRSVLLNFIERWEDFVAIAPGGLGSRMTALRIVYHDAIDLGLRGSGAEEAAP